MPNFFVGEAFCAVFQKISGSEKRLWMRGGGYQGFPSKVFSSRSGEEFRQGKLLCCVSECFRWRKTLWIKEGGYQDFLSKNFFLTMPKSFATESFCVVFEKTSGNEKDFG